jgi:hypothetical protein
LAQILELEGTWEEIQARSAELAGKRVHVSVLPDELPTSVMIPPENATVLALLDEWRQTALDPEEEQALDEFQTFRMNTPVTLRNLAEP